MKAQALENTETQYGILKQGLTWLDTTVKQVWNYDRRLRLQFKSEQVESWTLKGTPYSIVKEAGQYFSVIGQARVSDTFKSRNECIKDAMRLDTNKVLQLAIMVAEEIKKRK